MQLQVVYMEVLELNPRQGIFDCLVPTFMLAPTKADPTAKERSCKRSTVDAIGAVGVEMILAVLGPFSLACGFGTTGLSLGE